MTEIVIRLKNSSSYLAHQIASKATQNTVGQLREIGLEIHAGDYLEIIKPLPVLIAKSEIAVIEFTCLDLDIDQIPF